MRNQSLAEGLFYGLPETEYAAAPGLSYRALRQILRSPAHFAAERATASEPQPCTPARLFGKLCHHLALTPHLPPFWAVMPLGLDRRTKEGRAFTAANSGRPTIDQETYAEAENAVHALRNYAPFIHAMDRARTEVSWFHTLHRNAATVHLKGRPDIVCSGPMLCELKFVLDSRPQAIAKAVHELGWDMQAAFYLDGYNRTIAGGQNPVPKNGFAIFAIEKQRPYAVNCFVVPPAVIRSGLLRVEAAIRRYLDCAAWQDFTPYSALGEYNPEPQMLVLPEAA